MTMAMMVAAAFIDHAKLPHHDTFHRYRYITPADIQIPQMTSGPCACLGRARCIQRVWDKLGCRWRKRLPWLAAKRAPSGALIHVTCEICVRAKVAPRLASAATPADVRPDAAADELAGTLRRHGGCAPLKRDIDIIAVLSRDPGARRRRTATPAEIEIGRSPRAGPGGGSVAVGGVVGRGRPHRLAG